MARRVDPLSIRVPIVNPRDGTPTPEFMRKWLRQNDVNVLAVEWLTRQIIAGSGLDGGGSLGDGDVTLTADVQEILDQISTTHGSILYRDSAAWAALGPGTDGDVLTTHGANADPTWETPAASGGGGYFNGATGVLGAASTSSFATKGIVFTPDVDIEVTHIIAFIDQNATTDNYQGIIAELASITSTGSQITAVGNTVTIYGPTSNVSSGSTDMRVLRFAFSSPITLSAGVDYFIGIVFNQASGTAAARVGVQTSGTTNAWSQNAPGKSYDGGVVYNTVGLSTSQAASSVGTGYFCVAIEGMIA